MLAVRRAHESDARALSLIAEETFRAAFGGMNAVEDIDLHCQSSYGAEVQAREIADPNMLTLLCGVSEELVGFAQLKWGGAPACVSARAPAEIQRLYVSTQWHGKGVAQALMRASIDEIVRRGSDAVWLGVWEHNPRAIAFYRKCGFVEVGDHEFVLGHDPQRDIVMVMPLSRSAMNAFE